MPDTLGADKPVTRRVSNSEVATYLVCERKYYYEFVLNLEPKVSKGALARGILFHDILAAYYSALQEWDNTPALSEYKVGKSRHDNAVLIARKRLMQYMAQASIFELDVVMEVDTLLRGYWDFYQGDPDWEILEVEVGHDLPLSNAYDYSMRLDLYIRSRSEGWYAIVDHKTTYDLWRAEDLDLNPQFPKYVGTLRANGMKVDRAILNQVRYRKIKNPTTDQLYRRSVCMPSNRKIAQAMREQIIVSGKITAYREQPLEVKAANSVRILNKTVCRSCRVKDLCMSEYDGGDIRHMIANDYKPRTYGYNPAEDGEL